MASQSGVPPASSVSFSPSQSSPPRSRSNSSNSSRSTGPVGGTTTATTAAAAAAVTTSVGITDCDICLGLLTNNVRCPQCKHCFCRACLVSWVQSQSLFTGVASCPSCRLPGSIDTFIHDADLQASIDQIVVHCEYECGAVFPWREHAAHMTTCPEANVPCPYMSCSFKGPRTMLDEHTYNCPHSRQYLGNPVLAKLPTDKLHSYSEIAEVLKNDVEEQTTKDGRKCLVHYVMDSDTLSGLSVRYGISKEEIRRVNGLIGDHLFTNNTVLIPIKEGYVPEARVQLSPEVVAALQKRKLVREVVCSTDALPEEAIAYLQMCNFDKNLAIRQYKDDLEWEKSAGKNKTKSLTDFLNRGKSEKLCHGCPNMLTPHRKHCTRCGKMFCQSCVSKGQCSRVLLKHELGVTSPDSWKDSVPVCNSCFRSMR